MDDVGHGGGGWMALDSRRGRVSGGVRRGVRECVTGCVRWCVEFVLVRMLGSWACAAPGF